MPVLGITGSIATGKSTFAQRLKRRLEAELFDADAVARELLESDPAVQREILSVFGPDVAGPDGAIDRARLRSIIFGPKGSQAGPQQRSPEGTASSDEARSGQLPSGQVPAGGGGEETVGKVAGESAASAAFEGLSDEGHEGFRTGDRPQAASGRAAGTVATGTKEIGNRVNVSSTPTPTPKEQLEAILHPRIRARWKELAATYRSTRPGSRRWLIIDIPLLFETGAEGAFDVIAVVACGAQTQQHRLRERGLDPEVAQAIIASQLDLATKMKRASHIIWSESSLTFLDEQAAVLAAHLQQRYG